MRSIQYCFPNQTIYLRRSCCGRVVWRGTSMQSVVLAHHLLLLWRDLLLHLHLLALVHHCAAGGIGHLIDENSPTSHSNRTLHRHSAGHLLNARLLLLLLLLMMEVMLSVKRRRSVHSGRLWGLGLSLALRRGHHMYLSFSSAVLT